MRLNDAIFRYLRERKRNKSLSTRDKDLSVLRLLSLRMHNIELEELTLEHIYDWEDAQTELLTAQNTLWGNTSKLKPFFKWCNNKGLPLQFNAEALEYPRFEPTDTDFLEEHEYERLLTAFDVDKPNPRQIRDKAIITLAHDSGLRSIEIVGLDEDDIDVDASAAEGVFAGKVRSAKNRMRNPYEDFFFSEEARKALKEWLKLKKEKGITDKALFVSLKGQTYGTRANKQIINTMLARYCKKVGLRRVASHELRRGYGNRLGEAGGSSTEIRLLMRHKDIRSSEPYTRANKRIKANAYARLHA